VRALEVQPDNYNWWYGLAVARLGTGDTPGYHRARSEILRRFRDYKDAHRVNNLCYICAVLPAEPDDAKAFLRMAEFAVGSTPDNPRIRGVMNYRAGKYEAAIADLNQSARVLRRRPWDWLILAMAHQKLGHADEAKKDLQEAEKWIETANRTDAIGSADRWMSWTEPMEGEYLLREARALIR
jgi:predicted Zn-dependent protease